jgi:hypothetical protein
MNAKIEMQFKSYISHILEAPKDNAGERKKFRKLILCNFHENNSSDLTMAGIVRYVNKF